MTKLFFAPLFLINTVTANGPSDSNCDFKLVCKNGDSAFQISLKSVSGDCSEDDMEGTFTSGNLTKKLSIKSDWYLYTDHVSKTQKSICGGEAQVNPFAAYSVGRNLALIFVKSSGRPGYAFVNAILLNSETGDVVDTKRLGSSRNRFIAVLKTKRGFKTRIVRDSLSFHKQVTCDCDASFVDDWLEVYVSKGKLKADWLR